MGLVDLPVEIFESIIDLAIPEFWNDSEDGPLALKLRLVCSKSRIFFDRLVVANILCRIVR
jgi:hypothetical protein